MDSLHTYSENLMKEYGIKNIPLVENMWGHRFRTDQTPSIIFFELLCVIENQFQAKKQGLVESIFCKNRSTLFLKHKQNFKLRILIYQNEILEAINNADVNDDEKWERQFSYLRSIKDEPFEFQEVDIKHIRTNFKTFDSFYNAIKILSSLTFDPMSNKRWTSKFIYPISSDYIWCDYDNKRLSEDRRFFSRGGELAYLMLCRTSKDKREKLESAFECWLEEKEDSFSKLANSLVRREERIKLASDKQIKLGYLPYINLTIFDDFSHDMSKVMSLHLERLDKVKVLVDLTGFHIGNYILSIAESYHNELEPSELKSPYYLTEIIAGGTNSIRKFSIQSVSAQRNKIKRSFSNRAASIAEKYISNFVGDDTNSRKKTMDDQIKNGMAYVTSHIANYPNVCFREIGLLSKKSSNSNRYVLTEEFLHSMVVVILGNEKRMELNKFITELKDSYSIYVDSTPELEPELIQRDLNKNARNLASLLYQMGMLRHLSDACSYVLNPYMEDSI